MEYIHTFLLVLSVVFLLSGPGYAKKARCEFSSMEGVNDTITGTVEFQQNKATENLTIKVNDVDGLTEGKHGFHIHANGDCKDPGSHYNPKGKNHGFIFDSDRDYHVGDFGNIDIEMDKPFMKTYTVSGDIAGILDDSKNKVLGKAFVIHESEDDLGLQGDQGSKTTGNAGRKLACCIISEVSSSSTRSHITICFLPISFLLALVVLT